MSQDQAVILLILLATVGMFVWGRWRHDMIAAGALLACVVAGLVPADLAFTGFAHPAVVTVACVLVLSYGLQTTGAVEIAIQRIPLRSASRFKATVALTVLAAALSAFMNNVGALALLMPVAIKAARNLDMAPGKLLMPVSFGSILGGMTTLIGTPPNLIVAGFRQTATGQGFSMFDFTPVGLAVAVVGVAFVVVVGWRVVPTRERAGVESFETAAYLTEVRLTGDSGLNGAVLRDAEEMLEQVGAQILSLIRNDVRIQAPHPLRKLRADDILVIEAEPEELASALTRFKLELTVGPESDTRAPPEAPEQPADEAREEIALTELVVLPGSNLAGSTAAAVGLPERYGVNLLAVSRQGRRSVARLRRMKLKEGDVLLMQGGEDGLRQFGAESDCVPLAARPLSIPDRSKAFLALAVMALAIVGASTGFVSPAISFAGGVLAMMAFGVVRRRGIYQSVDWPVIVLLGALIPVAGAFASTGAAELVARFLWQEIAQGHAVVALVVFLVVTMTLSDFMNNAATAAVMCPIVASAADTLGANPDPFLMAVAVGASCAFLTPIGHQNNTLILGPGGFRFGDYWRLGLPIEIIVIAVGVPMILLVWPI